MRRAAVMAIGLLLVACGGEEKTLAGSWTVFELQAPIGIFNIVVADGVISGTCESSQPTTTINGTMEPDGGFFVETARSAEFMMSKLTLDSPGLDPEGDTWSGEVTTYWHARVGGGSNKNSARATRR